MRPLPFLALTLSACLAPTSSGTVEPTEAPPAFDAPTDVQTRPDAQTPEAEPAETPELPDATIDVAHEAPHDAAFDAAFDVTADAAPHCPSTCATYCLGSTCAGNAEGAPCRYSPSAGACPAGLACKSYSDYDGGVAGPLLCMDPVKSACGYPQGPCCEYSLVPYECPKGLTCRFAFGGSKCSG